MEILHFLENYYLKEMISFTSMKFCQYLQGEFTFTSMNIDLNLSNSHRYYVFHEVSMDYQYQVLNFKVMLYTSFYFLLQSYLILISKIS